MDLSIINHLVNERKIFKKKRKKERTIFTGRPLLFVTQAVTPPMKVEKSERRAMLLFSCLSR